MLSTVPQMSSSFEKLSKLVRGLDRNDLTVTLAIGHFSASLRKVVKLCSKNQVGTDE